MEGGTDMGRRVILVVEDNSDELTIYTTLLTYHGFDVLTATDFESALETAREGQPDLAVIDVNLGEGQRDGCELATALRAEPATEKIRILAHTAYGDVYRRRLEDAGCASILHKPSNPNQLLSTIRKLLAS
jgi:two-component system, sensor histidine kinase